jgi:hypothetical protein
MISNARAAVVEPSSTACARLAVRVVSIVASLSMSTPARSRARPSCSATIRPKARGTSAASGRASVGSSKLAVCNATNISIASRLSSSTGTKLPSSARSISRGASPAAATWRLNR